jgi:hypothetical protein
MTSLFLFMDGHGSPVPEGDPWVPGPLDDAQEMYPDYTPSRNFDQEAVGCQWTQFRPGRRFWEYLILTVSLITPIEISYVIIFDRNVSARDYTAFFFLDVLQVIDNFVIVKTPITDHGVLVTDWGRIITRYGRIAFVLHIGASLPLGWLGLITRNFRLYVWLSIARLVRLARSWRAYKTIFGSTLYRGTINRLYPYCIIFVFVVHVFACLCYGMALAFDGDQSFIAPWLGLPPVEQYIAAVYYVLTAILTIGYGDVVPVTTRERCVTMIMEVVGVTIESLIIAKMASAASDIQGSTFIVQYNAIRQYLKAKETPAEDLNHVRHYYQTVWATTHGAPTWAELLRDVPESLRNQIKLELCERAIQGLELLRAAHQSDKMQLMDYLQAVTFMPGERICTQNEQLSDLFIFTSGTYRMMRDDVVLGRQTVDNPLFDGERELLLDEPRGKTLIAETFVEAWRLKRYHLWLLVQANSEFKRLVTSNARRRFPQEFSGWHRRGELFRDDEPPPSPEHSETGVFGEYDFSDEGKAELSH